MAKSLKVGAAVIGSEIVGFTVLGIAIDYALGTLSSVPWATLILSPLGLVVAMIHLLSIVKQPDAGP